MLKHKRCQSLFRYTIVLIHYSFCNVIITVRPFVLYRVDTSSCGIYFQYTTEKQVHISLNFNFDFAQTIAWMNNCTYMLYCYISINNHKYILALYFETSKVGKMQRWYTYVICVDIKHKSRAQDFKINSFQTDISAQQLSLLKICYPKLRTTYVLEITSIHIISFNIYRIGERSGPNTHGQRR